MKEKFEQPVIEVVTFDDNADIITASGDPHGGCNHGGNTGNNKPQNPWPWWPWWNW